MKTVLPLALLRNSSCVLIHFLNDGTLGRSQDNCITPVTLNYATQNGTATADNASPANYSARSGGLTFAPNQTTRTVAVTIYGDTRVESNETFALNLSNVVGATLSRTAATGTITNDD